MVDILPGLLNQVAIYWPIGALTQSGRRDYASVTPVEVACHWTYEVTYKTTPAGQLPKSSARVLTLVEVVEGGLLWLSTATINDEPGTALAQIPVTVPTNNTIEVVERHYSISADEILYKAYV